MVAKIGLGEVGHRICGNMLLGRSRHSVYKRKQITKFRIVVVAIKYKKSCNYQPISESVLYEMSQWF